MNWRAAAPIAIILVGLTLLIYGAARHHLPVVVDEELAPPPITQLPGPGTAGIRSRTGDIFSAPPKPPQPVHVLRLLAEPEARIVLEVTRGGIARTDDGRLKLTYSGAPPSGCPT